MNDFIVFHHNAFLYIAVNYMTLQYIHYMHLYEHAQSQKQIA